MAEGQRGVGTQEQLTQTERVTRNLMFIIPVTFSWSGIRFEGHGIFSFLHLSLRGLRGSRYECKEKATGRQFREVFAEVPHPLTKELPTLRAFNRSEARSPCYYQLGGFGHTEYTFNLNTTQHIKLCVLKYTFLVRTRLGNSLYVGGWCLTHPFSI